MGLDAGYMTAGICKGLQIVTSKASLAIVAQTAVRAFSINANMNINLILMVINARVGSYSNTAQQTARGRGNIKATLVYAKYVRFWINVLAVQTM